MMQYQYSCKQHINENTIDHGKSKEWTWEELGEEILEGQLEKLADLVPERSTIEVKSTMR
ncbi:hypothetical protein TSUD_246640 [Trifolium subterraneum]|uniref:Uncharacterized protein n=1 Tax=Trifolium subterraneum TaxID=3900 RepID=A0A2Z6NQR2_TRISU|nr:hypothetical protein TSUD_246640 [Trifolium subterraneum]